MSLIYTESFGAFGRYSGSDAWDTSSGAGNAARAAYALNLARAGYAVVNAANAAKDSSGGLVVRADPVYPERNALVHSSDVTAGVNLGVSAAFRRQIPITDKQIIIGFSVYVPMEYVPNTANSTVPCLRINATTQADASWQAIGIAIATAKECLRICNDLSIRWGTDAAQSARRLAVGAMNYIELRISATDVSVWVDDVFVMQKAVSLIPQTIAFVFENNANAGSGGTNMSGNPGRWALGNMYYMAIDGIAPQQRLGPTTRVIAQRPDTDVDVRFIRPTSYASNSAVAAQDLVDNPPGQLQSTTVGDFDLYQTVGGNSGDSIRTMAMVHAVAVKALAQNLEPDVHNVRPFLKYGASAVEGADQKLRDLVAINSPTSKTIRGMVTVPTDNSILIFGDGEAVYRSGPNGNTDTWTRVMETGSAYNFYSAYSRGDGVILLFQWNGATTGTTGYRFWFNPNDNSMNRGDINNNYLSSGAVGVYRSPDGTRLVQPMPEVAGAATAGGVGFLPAATFNGATPATGGWTNGGSFTLNPTTPALATGGWANVISKPDYSATILFGNTGNQDYIYRVVAGNGFAVLQAPHNLTGVQFRVGTWDGSQWLIGATTQGGTNSSPMIYSSTDGAAWSAPTLLGNNNAGANQFLRFAASNTSNGESIFGGDAGSLMMSLDGKNWRQLPRLTTKALYCGIAKANGDFIIGGQDGVLFAIRASGADTPLLPLAGYSMAFGSSVFNPATASPWTPAQAADAKFGVKLTT
jgi:hypothetical protein